MKNLLGFANIHSRSLAHAFTYRKAARPRGSRGRRKNGIIRIATISAAVCIHHIVSHHLPVVYHRPAAWLTVLEALHLITSRPAYRRVFEFWLKIFGVAFGLGVVSGIVMAFQLGSNWSELSRMSGPIQGRCSRTRRSPPCFLEASFFGIVDFEKRWPEMLGKPVENRSTT